MSVLRPPLLIVTILAWVPTSASAATGAQASGWHWGWIAALGIAATLAGVFYFRCRGCPPRPLATKPPQPESIGKEWHAAFDAIDDPIFIHDDEMRIVQANTAYCQRAGKALEDLLGEHYYLHFPKLDAPLPACQTFPEKLHPEGDELTLENGETYISRSFGFRHGGAEAHAIHILEDVTAEHRARALLNERIAMETLLADLASRFVTIIDQDELDGALLDALERLGKFTAAERAYLFRHDTKNDTISNTHEWCAAGIGSKRQTQQDLPFDTFPWLKKQLRQDQTVAVDDVSALPEEAAAERAEFEREHIRSLLLAPVTSGGRNFGFIGFDFVTQSNTWDESSVRLLRTASELIANAIGRISAVEKVRKSEKSLAAAQRIAHIGNWDWNIATGDLAWSDEIYRIFGLTPQEFGATYEAFLETVHPDDRQHVIDNVNRAVAGETDYEIDHRIVLPDGQVRTVHEKGDLLHSETGEPLRMIGTVLDVTEARQNEDELMRLNRALNTLSRCNTSLVHATDETTLMRVICNILIESGNYCFAWVGYAEHDEGKTIRPVAHAGHEEGFLDTLNASWADGTNGETPAGIAIRDCQPFIERDIGSAPSSPWRDAALSRGYASVISFPLYSQETVYGAITIDSTEKDAFDGRELALLQEMAGDLAFGISTLRSREELHRLEQRYEDLYENAPNAYVTVSAGDGRLIQFNQALCDMLGYDHETLTGMRVFDLYVEGKHGTDVAKRIFERFLRGEAVRDEELQMRTKSGEPLWVSLSVDPVFDENGTVVESRSMAINIAARKRAEAERTQAQEQLKRSLLQTIQAISITIEKRDPYTAGHQERVSRIAVAIAEGMGLDADRIEGLRLGAMLHDIGKVSVPVEILNRPGKLEPEMFAFIRAHPEVGHEIIKGIEFPWPLAELVLQHHERLDGSGYPRGLKGDEIMLEARILAVADVIEAMASHRPYRGAVGVEAAMAVIDEGKGKLFDPDVVEACQRLFSEKGERWPFE